MYFPKFFIIRKNNIKELVMRQLPRGGMKLIFLGMSSILKVEHILCH